MTARWRVTHSVLALASVLAACGSAKKPLALGSNALTSEGGYSVSYQVQVSPGDAVSWSLDPPIGSLSGSGTTPDHSRAFVTYTPPAVLQVRNAFTKVIITASSAEAAGSGDIYVYPDPCHAGVWRTVVCPSAWNQPGGCGFCGGTLVDGSQLPPPDLLLGGQRTGGLGEVYEFDVNTCTWTVTYPGDPSSASSASSCGSLLYGVVARVSFNDGTNEFRELCRTQTGCCEPLLTDCVLSRGSP